MNFEKYLSNFFFVSGIFFQIDWFNPLYLDKTGLLIKLSRENIIKWYGNAEGFDFQEKENLYSGKVSISKLWLKWNNLTYFNKFNIEEALDTFIKQSLFLSENYEAVDYKRIGFRLQGILSKIKEKNVEKYNSISKTVFNDISSKYEIETSEVVSAIKYDPINVRLSLSFAKKESNDFEGPDKGFLFDFDINQKHEAKPMENLKDDLYNIKEFYLNKFEELLSLSFKTVRYDE